MRIVFFGTSEVGLPTLEALAQQHQVVGVVTGLDAPVGRKQVLTPSPVGLRAQELGLLVLKPEKVKNNPEVLEQLEKLVADIYIVVSYGKILPKELIDAPPLKTLNVHFSLLPLYRGAAPIQGALKNGDASTGTTIFVLDELLDHGPILAQVTEPIRPDDTFTTLAQRMANISAEKLIEILPLYQSGALVPHGQDHNLATKVPMLKKEDGKTDWSKTAQEIYNMWRAYQPWPGVYTTWNGKLLKITECIPLVPESTLSSAPSLEEGQGEVVVKNDDISKFTMTPSNSPSRVGELGAAAASSYPPPNIEGARGGIITLGTVLPNGIITCGQNTYLQILTLQLEGKQPMSIESFLNGNKSLLGEVLM